MKKALLISALQILIFVLFACNTAKDKNKPRLIDKVLSEQKEFLIGQDRYLSFFMTILFLNIIIPLKSTDSQA